VNNRKAFSLIEVIIVLAIIGILAGLAVPAALRLFEVTAEETTRQEMDNIKRAILGDARKLQSSFRSDFGYIGDIGCLPDDLRRILLNPPPPPPVLPALPTWTFDSTKQTGAGWKGPYITGAATGQEVEEFTKDQWGNDYTYTVTGGPCPPAPTGMTATLTSGGANLGSTADDIIISIVAGETTATVRGTVKNTAGAGLAAVSVELYSAVNAAVTTTTATTDANGNYSVTSVPFGQRAVMANPTGLVLVSGSVTVSNGDATNDNVNFQVINYTASPITVGRITVNCVGTLATRYDDIRVGTSGTDLSGANNIVCAPTQTQITLSTSQTVPANSTPPSSLRVVVDSADTQLPDFTLRGGGIMTFRIEEFETAAGSVDMSGGQTITVSFFTTLGVLISTVTVVTP